jgi:hypothetical protein
MDSRLHSIVLHSNRITNLLMLKPRMIIMVNRYQYPIWHRMIPKIIGVHHYHLVVKTINKKMLMEINLFRNS